MAWRGVIEQYRKLLPVTEKTPVISINEGGTPLIRARNLERHIDGGLQIWLKYEGLNPTASFKDRGMTVAVSLAVERGAKAIICASTGNTSSSAAAYAARAGIKCVVILPEGGIAKGKLAQAMMYGATVIAVKGNFDDALNIVRDIGEKTDIQIVNSINPDRIEGQKTAAFEICDALGRAPDYHVLPVGNAGNITAYWKGYVEYGKACPALGGGRPKMVGFQAEGAAPIVRGHPVEKPQTVASAIRIGNPASWKAAIAAREDSGGLVDMVSDKEILDAYRLVASKEGVFVEPASAAGIAGLIKNRDFFAKGSVVAVTLTGHGLKDPDTAIASAPAPLSCEAKTEAVLKIISH